MLSQQPYRLCRSSIASPKTPKGAFWSSCTWPGRRALYIYNKAPVSCASRNSATCPRVAAYRRVCLCRGAAVKRGKTDLPAIVMQACTAPKPFNQSGTTALQHVAARSLTAWLFTLPKKRNEAGCMCTSWQLCLSSQLFACSWRWRCASTWLPRQYVIFVWLFNFFLSAHQCVLESPLWCGQRRRARARS